MENVPLSTNEGLIIESVGFSMELETLVLETFFRIV